MAAVVTSHLGSSPLGVPDWAANDVMLQQPTESSYTQHHHQDVSTSSKSLRQQLQRSQAAQQLLAAGSTVAPQTDPNAVLYANYRAQHAQAYAAADQLTYGSDVSSAAAIAAAAQQQQHQRQQDMLTTERAFQASQLAQQQQQLAYEQAQQQQQLLLAHAQQQQQQRHAAATASALYHASSSQSTMTHQQQQQPSSNYSLHQQQRQPSLYPANTSMQGPQTTTAAQLPPRPTTAHSQHFHPYSSATGAAILEHHAQAADSRQQHHNSLVAAAATARAAAIQQQQQHQQRGGSGSAASTARQTANAAAMAAAAALQRSRNTTGRWLGAVAVLDQDSQESSGEPCGLECDEDLQSMDGLDHAPHHHMMHSSAATSGKGSSLAAAAAAATAGQAAAARAHAAAAAAAQHKSQLQGARLSGGAAQHAAAVSAAARAAAAGYALSALEDDEQAFDMYEDSGSTHPDSDNQSDDMDADVLLVQDQHARASRHCTSAAHPRAPSAGQPGSSRYDAATAAAAAAAVAEHDASARQAVAVRVLSSVANRRKGEQVLTVHPAVADAAGAQSVRSRLLITEVSLYCDNAATSMLAMEQSNRLMAKMALPGEGDSLLGGHQGALSGCGKVLSLWSTAPSFPEAMMARAISRVFTPRLEAMRCKASRMACCKHVADCTACRLACQLHAM